MDEALIGWLFFGLMLLWRFVSRSGPGQRESCDRVDVQRHIRKICCLTPRLQWFLQWYTITGLGLTLLMARSMFDVWKYDYKSAHYLDPAIIYNKIPDHTRFEIVQIPGWLRMMSLFAPLIGTVGFVITMRQSWLLVKGSLKANVGKDDWLLHRCIDQLLIVIGVPLVFIVFSLRALVRQWEVMTGSFCWSYWDKMAECPYHEKDLVADQCKLDMYFATAFQFYAMWEFGELCGHFISDHRLSWREEEGNTERPADIMRDYRRTIKWTSVLAVFAFVGIGLLKSIVEFGLTVALNVLPQMSGEVKEKIALVDKKVNSVFAFATVLCVLNMLLISNMWPLRDALGENISLKFHGTRTMLLVVQIQPQVLDFFVTEPGKEHGWASEHQLTFLHPDQSVLLNVTLVLYWCFFVSVASAFIWKLDFELVSHINNKARDIDNSLSAPLIAS